MEKVLVDIGFGQNRRTTKESVGGIVGLPVVERLWEIDKVYGKKICLIELDIPSMTTYLNFTPSHDFCERLLGNILKCEWGNDRFIFANPKLNESRPAQLDLKLRQLKSVIKKWDDLANTEGIPGARP